MTTTTFGSKKSDATVRLDAWRGVFEKTNRIISQRPVTVQVVDDVPSGMEEIPGWSDGEVVHFNGPLVLDMLREQDSMAAVLRLKGLNYHELSHVLYTPRMSEELPKAVVARAQTSGDKRWWYSFNALEDQRIETWFTASYGPSRRYFEAAVLQWLIQKGNAEAAILTYGRKYLPSRIRVQAGRVFVAKYGQGMYDEFKAVIDGYLTVVLPADSIRGLSLVSKFRDLLNRMQSAGGCGLPTLPVEDNGCHSGQRAPGRDDPSVVRVGRVLQREAKAARDAAKKAAAEAKEADAEAQAEIEAEGEPKDGDVIDIVPGKPEGPTTPVQIDGDLDLDAPGNDGEGEGKGKSDQHGEGGDPTHSGGQGAGTEGGGEHHVLDRDELDATIKAMVKEAESGLDAIMADPEVQADVNRVLDAVKAVVNDGNINATGSLAKNRGTIPATTEEQASVRRIVSILSKIRQEVEPEILRGMPSGRVDVRRFIQRRPTDFDIFTTYDEGAEDETGIEAVVLLDVSGSMGGIMQQASSAVWVMKRAFDKLDIRTTCLVYDTEHYVLFQPSDKAKPDVPVINTMGGTDPSTALAQAQIILGKSHKPNKVLITVTDGAWNGTDGEYKAQMKALKRLGTTSLLVGLNRAEQRYGKHSHDVGHDIGDVTELPKAALKLVGAIMRRATNTD